MITINQLLESKSRELYSVGPDDLVSDVLTLLARQKIGALLVLEQNKLVGIVSERDCAIRVALPGKRADETRVKDVMTSNVITVDPSKTLEECMKQMNDRDIRHLPVVVGGAVIGMVSIGDVSKQMLKQQHLLIQQLETYIRGGYTA